ncbi:hypothetical protein MAP00_006946 [Monascus purpureus]|nr:hypothetical protein MAP00_006946 [Monascus purpureus]
MAGSKIACIGVIGKDDNPLHISLFPPYLESTIEFSFLLNSCLDVFEIRQKQTSVDQDLGLLHAVDERLAAYGWLTTTGVKFIIIVDFLGQPVPSKMEGPRSAMVATLRDSDLKPVFRALQTAYIQLLQNPFYLPDDYIPAAKTMLPLSPYLQITNRKFIADIRRIGESWNAGVMMSV